MSELEDRPQGSISEPMSEYPDERDAFSLLDVLLLLIRNIKVIGITTIASVILGLLIAIFSPPKYTASARVIRETAQESPGGLAGGLAALRGLGISIGGSSIGLTAEIYPDILMSREVHLAVARSSFYFDDLDATMSLVDYYNRPPGVLGFLWAGLKNVTIELPGTIIRMLRDENPGPITFGNSGEIVYPTEKEEDSIKWLKGLVRVNVDRNTGIMSIAVTTRDPLLSAQLTQVLIENLTQRVRSIYTQKAREDLEFIRARFAEAHQELEAAEEELANFMDRNQDPRTAKLRTEMDRLQRAVSFKTQLYGDLQTQLTQAEIELQRSRPVITLLEAPVPPLEKSAPKRTMIVIISFMLGIGLGLGLTYARVVVSDMETNRSQAGKLAELQQAVTRLRQDLPLKRVLVFWRRPKS